MSTTIFSQLDVILDEMGKAGETVCAAQLQFVIDTVESQTRAHEQAPSVLL